MTGAAGASDGWPSYAPIFMTCVISSRKIQNSSQNLFGNVRIPSFETLAPPRTIGIESWRTVNPSQEISYSSMLGIPVVGINPTGNLTFNLVSRYLAVNCNNSIHLTNESIFTTGAGLAANKQGASFIVQHKSIRQPDPGSEIMISFNITSRNSLLDNTEVSNIQCTMAPRDVESSVFCRDQSCQVTAMRNVTIDPSSGWQKDYPKIAVSFGYLPIATCGPLIHSLNRSSLTDM
jgi:hypothetical protein